HQGDGLLFVYNRVDPGQFSDDYWPTVDPDKLPGITGNGAPNGTPQGGGTGAPKGSNDYAGGVLLGADLGTTGMDFRSSSGNLIANKSWHFLDDSVVCVGTGIEDQSGTDVFTVVENRSFPEGEVGDVVVDGRKHT